MNRLILGIDPGGSKCEALIVREDGEAIGYGRQPDGSDELEPNFGGAGRTRSATLASIRQAAGGETCDELHCCPGACLAGYISAVAEILLGPGREAREHIHIHGAAEWDLPMAAAGASAGIVVVAGTGALVWGTTRDGRSIGLDGLGPDLGDHGGGYQIGLQGLRAVAAADWHPRRATSLVEPVMSACGLAGASPRNLIGYLASRPDRSRVASIAEIVTEAAETGDAIARSILESAADDIAETVRDVADTLGMTRDEYAVVASGSVATKSAIYWERLCERIREFAPLFRPCIPDLPPVAGGVLIAAQKMGIGTGPEFRGRLKGSLDRLTAQASG